MLDGPGKVTKALNINKKFNGLVAGVETGLWFEDRGVKVDGESVRITKRIGVDYAGDWKEKLWNFRFIIQRLP